MQKGAGRTHSPGTDPLLFYIPDTEHRLCSVAVEDVPAADFIDLKDPGYEIFIIFISVLSVVNLFVTLIPRLNPRRLALSRSPASF
jgi:hypothetical protein